MMTISSRAVATVFASLLLMGSAFAQTTAPAAPAQATTTAPKTEKPRSAASLECSKEADEKGLKSKERHKFMRKCNKDAKAKAAEEKK
jgi:hypothetical protein